MLQLTTETIETDNETTLSTAQVVGKIIVAITVAAAAEVADIGLGRQTYLKPFGRCRDVGLWN